jgi:23S rRNA (cytidine1920-2'-O)/16S rRNA (cytidine1409-2'-O)-methyltransferase
VATPRRRLDAELARRGLVGSRAEAQEAIAGGLVTVDGAPATKAATQVTSTQQLRVSAPARAYVSRGGEKLAHALTTFGVDPSGRRCLDAGVSTGGFTDCLLQRGAAHVLAFDVGYGQVHERLRTDPRVTVAERTNVRDLTPADLASPPPDLVVADLSFISLTTVLPTLREVSAPDAEAVLLVKPQFEAQRSQVGKGGVVRDPGVWRACIERVLASGAAVGWRAAGIAASALLGPAGNVEFVVHLTTRVPVTPVGEDTDDDLGRWLDAALAEGQRLRGGRAAGEGS